MELYKKLVLQPNLYVFISIIYIMVVLIYIQVSRALVQDTVIASVQQTPSE